MLHQTHPKKYISKHIQDISKISRRDRAAPDSWAGLGPDRAGGRLVFCMYLGYFDSLDIFWIYLIICLVYFCLPFLVFRAVSLSRASLFEAVLLYCMYSILCPLIRVRIDLYQVYASCIKHLTDQVTSNIKQYQMIFNDVFISWAHDGHLFVFSEAAGRPKAKFETTV